uniref:NADH-ubiquinone oxidoreductase chain 5 n=1 Tax=Paratrichobius longicrus TaxID=402416 RepID=A0A5B9RFL7_9MUSC|nr:NADH dehydrogenase subunit 5 [Paratrichobius longicrus]QEG77651.1 NADH dehydrogenase subunit 5 [Paratrichobius longicrus]
MCLLNFFFFFFFMFISFFFSLYYLLNDLVEFYDFEIISFNSFSISMSLLIDWMSMMFLSFVFLISSLVIFYSSEYMLGDINLNRFIMLVIMFIISMVLLIISPNLISILLGWDGLGLVSYCLVIYYQNIKSYNAGMITVLMNRLGDVAMLMVISWMLSFGSWNFIFIMNDNSLEVVVISSLIILAAMTKSAQIPFCSWLPAAMAAPTPVSALVHSSTLVTAGIYLLIRFNELLMNLFMIQLLLILSSLTMFMAGLGANYEFDLKKIIALSTLSQLGLMMGILMMGYSDLAFFHLLMHALFKALMFMCAGLIIHNMNNCQDIRLMGSLSFMMPITSSIFNVGNLALCGMPFLAGFYSKDLILEMICLSDINILIFFLYFISTGLTVCYSIRLMYFLMVKNFMFYSLNIVNDESWIMLKSMMLLMIFSVIAGSMISWLIFKTPKIIVLPFYLKILTLFVVLFGGLIGYYINNVSLYYFNKSMYFYFSSNFLGNMWFMPSIFTYGLVNYFLLIGKFVYKFDVSWLEYFGSNGLFFLIKDMSKLNYLIHNNSLKIYLLSFIIWFIFIILFI